MKARLFFPFAVAVLIALISMFLPTARLSTTVFAQQPAAQPAGRGQQGQGKQAGGNFGRGNTPTFAGPPAGMQALPLDLFLSKNFYKDQKLWSDQRYFRCNTPRQLTDIWTSHRIGEKPPASASWSDCSIDYPREKIVSPYPYKTAKEHYEALLAAAKAKGGPTVYTKATTPGLGRILCTGSASRSWRRVDLGDRQPGLHHPVSAHAGISKAHGADKLSRGRGQLAAMGSLLLLSGRIHALVGASLAGRKFPADDDSVARPVPVRHRGQLPAPGPDRKRARAKGSAVVRRDGWILGRNHSDHLDRKCSRLDALALHVRIQRQDGDG